MRLLLLSAALLLASTGFLAAQTDDEAAAREAAQRFGAALAAGDTAGLRPILPARGKIQLRLVRLGPEEGYYSAAQVEALLLEAVRRSPVASFRTLRVEQDSRRFALVHGVLTLARGGPQATIDVHLVFQPEGQRWTLREIRETAP